MAIPPESALGIVIVSATLVVFLFVGAAFLILRLAAKDVPHALIARMTDVFMKAWFQILCAIVAAACGGIMLR